MLVGAGRKSGQSGNGTVFFFSAVPEKGFFVWVKVVQNELPPEDLLRRHTAPFQSKMLVRAGAMRAACRGPEWKRSAAGWPTLPPKEVRNSILGRGPHPQSKLPFYRCGPGYRTT